MPTHDERLFLTTTPGLEPALESECRALGLPARAEPGGVTVHGPWGLHRELNLWLRTASRVLLRLAELPAQSPEQLTRELRRLDLSPFRGAGMELELSVSSHASRLRADRLEELAREALGAPRPPTTRRAPDEEDVTGVRCQLRLERERCIVSIDTSGALLHRRGYRQEVSHAPLRETLAAGLLVLAGYQGDRPLLDPMCGSGAIVIEAALIALRRAPGLQRGFAFERFPSFDAGARAAFAERRRRATEGERRPAFKLRASDLHAGALGAARRNARRAGVGELLVLERQDVAKLGRPEGAPGFVITNPPYGKRVGERQGLPALYAALGKTVRGFAGFRFGILIADEGLERQLALPVTAVHRVQNGGLWCRFLVGEIPG